MKVDKYVKEDGEKRTFAYVNANRIQFLSTKKNENNPSIDATDENIFNPAFGLDPNEFMAIDDGDIPF